MTVSKSTERIVERYQEILDAMSKAGVPGSESLPAAPMLLVAMMLDEHTVEMITNLTYIGDQLRAIRDSLGGP